MINNIIPSIEKLIPNTALKLHQTLKQAGYPTYVVGGWLRNIISDQLKYSESFPKHKSDITGDWYDWGDIDFATAATPDQVTSLFPHHHPTGIKHGTVTVIIDNDAYEVTTFRCEGKYLDNRRPQNISFAQTLEEDLIRRDFTVNALAYEPSIGKFVDLFNGVDDIRKGVIRVICKHPEPPVIRFQEDALRMMRACRLVAQFGFTIEPKTLEAISISANLINNISKERVRDELIKTVIAPQAAEGLEYLRTTGIMKAIIPELSKTISITQNRFHTYDVYHHSLRVLSALNQLQRKNLDKKTTISYQLSLAGLFHDIAKPETKTIDPQKTIDGEPHANFYGHEIVGSHTVSKILKRLKFSNQDISTVSHLVRHHMFHYTSEWKDGTVRRFVSRVKTEYIEPLFLLRQADRLGKGEIEPAYQEDNRDLEELNQRIEELINEKSFLNLGDLAINGDTLMSELKLKPGPILGYLLKQLLEQVLDEPELNQKDYLLKTARKLLQEKKK